MGDAVSLTLYPNLQKKSTNPRSPGVHHMHQTLRAGARRARASLRSDVEKRRQTVIDTKAPL